MKYRYEVGIRDNIDVAAQIGGQETVLKTVADFTIIGGKRGGGKSFSLDLDPLYDIHNPEFRAMIYRKELKQLTQGGGLHDTALKLYPHLGGDPVGMKFRFPSGAIIEFDHIQNESKDAIEKRFKGMQYPCIMLDECDQLQFFTIVQMMGSNRNTNNIPTRNRIIGSCNPSVNKWTRKWLDWYIGDDGYIIKERDGKIRYFFIYGKSVNDVVWGNSVRECYEQAKQYIDPLVVKGGHPRDFINSFCFIEMSLDENKKLSDKDPKYRAKVAMGGASHAARNLLGNWNIADDEGEEMVNRDCLDNMFKNVYQKTGRIRMSVDVALEGKDSCVIFIWDGLHIVKVIHRPYLKSDDLRALVERLMKQYNIRITDVYYDKVGNGSPAMDKYPLAHGIEANAKPYNDDASFANRRSQILWNLGILLQEGKISIDDNTLYSTFPYGVGSLKTQTTLREILYNEMRVLIIDESEGKTQMLRKRKGVNSMKARLGFSPDFLDAMAYGITHMILAYENSGITGLENL